MQCSTCFNMIYIKLWLHSTHLGNICNLSSNSTTNCFFKLFMLIPLVFDQAMLGSEVTPMHFSVVYLNQLVGWEAINCSGQFSSSSTFSTLWILLFFHELIPHWLSFLTIPNTIMLEGVPNTPPVPVSQVFKFASTTGLCPAELNYSYPTLCWLVAPSQLRSCYANCLSEVTFLYESMLTHTCCLPSMLTTCFLQSTVQVELLGQTHN